MFTKTHNTRRSLAVAAAVALAAAGPLAACGSDSEDAGSASTTEVSADSAVTASGQWARTGTAGANTAVYMNLTGGEEDDALVGVAVSSDVAADAQIHETVMDGTDSSEAMEEGEMNESGDMEPSDATGTEGEATEGEVEADDTGSGDMDSGDMDSGSMMSMQEVESIEIPAGSTVSLEPGGFHIMLLDLGEDLVVGDSVEVTLTFESGAEQKVTAEVREG